MDVVILNSILKKAQDLLSKANSDSGHYWFRIYLLVHDLQLIIDDIEESLED